MERSEVDGCVAFVKTRGRGGGVRGRAEEGGLELVLMTERLELGGGRESQELECGSLALGVRVRDQGQQTVE